MSIALFRTHPHSSLLVSSRPWFSHKCLHGSSPAPSSSSATNAHNKSSVVKALGLTASQTRKTPKRIKRPEHKPTENLVKKHLMGLRNDTLTSKDVEALKPKEMADPKSSDYETQYKKVLDSLMKAFTFPQLRQYLESTGANSSPSKKNKLEIAEYILEARWGWTPLKQVLQDRVDWTEMSEQHFSLEPGYSFLLVGKDGTELLKLSRRYSVQMSFTDPRSLKVTGLKGALKQIAGYIETFKKDIEVEDFSLPSEGNVAILADRISRMSGAYVKTKDDSKISISFLKSQPQARESARRLILQMITNENPSTRAIYRLETSDNTNASSPSSYFLYPFLPPQPLPWQKASSSIFRYRRVGEWLKTPQSDKPESHFEKPETNHGTALLDNESEIDIKSHLLGQLGDIEKNSCPPLFTVSSGHLLFLSPANQRTTLIPPLTGQVDAKSVLRWISQSQDQVIFQPSVSSKVLSIPVNQEHNIRRLVYRTVKSAQSDALAHKNSSRLVTTLTFELPVRELRHETDDAPDSPVDMKRASLVKSIDTGIDLFVPDGSADIKISASSIQSVPASSWPEELVNAVLSSQLNKAETETSASFPLTLTHDGLEFYFCNDVYVHRSTRELTWEGSENGRSITVETSVDHETGQSMTTCKAVCDDHSSIPEWHNFLQICSLLSVPRSKAQHPLGAPFAFQPL